MFYILTPDETRLADSTAINEYNIKGELLMENAARSASDILVDILLESEIENPSILVLCGSGNNGGDGFALARHLSNFFDVRIIWIGNEDRMSPETKQNFEIIKKLGISHEKVLSDIDLNELDFKCDLICDALIGVGGNEDLKGVVIDVLRKANTTDAYKVAIDVPSGLNAHTGFAHQDAFEADLTITMFAPKTGMLLNDGIDICGEIEIASLGAPDRIVADIANIGVLEDEDVEELLPFRDPVSSKFDYGRVLIIAGSEKMPGAAALTANAAIKSGAGLVYLMTPKLHPAIKPEIIPTVLPTDDNGYISYSAKEMILAAAEKADVIAIGPGIGFSNEIKQLISELLDELLPDLPIILDADAIRALDITKTYNRNLILTPHIGEFSLMTGIPREEIYDNHSLLVEDFTRKLNCTVLLKHIPSIVTDGGFSIWNLGGNPGMSTAGSGDVLTGIISSLLGQGLEPLEAVSVGAFIHSKAGDNYAENYSESSLTATDLINELDNVFKEYEN